MKYLILILLSLLMSLLVKSQTNMDSLLIEIENHHHKVFNSRIYKHSEKKKHVNSEASKTFESQGLFHSTYLILNDDSSYIYYSVFEVGFILTTGNWGQYKSDTLTLNWDKEKTLMYVKDEKISRKYFQYYGPPTFIPMTNWLIKKSDKKIEPIASNLVYQDSN